VVSTVIVDVHHTSHTNLATGIQRVARNAAREWTTAHDVLLVRWDKSGRNLRALTREERDNATGLDGSRGETPASPGHPALDAPSPRARLIPWGGTYILPELAIEDTRTNRIAALAEYSACRTVAIGFDCVPITTSETVAPGMGAGFSRYLSALTHFSAVAAISVAARDEFAGWRRMLAGTGLTGPDIREAVLPATAEESSPEDLAAARARFDVPSIPLVLCVGSHEPRKNHMAVLHAAEMLWRDGQHFTLVFVGGNAWRARPFLTKARELETAGRPVRIIAGAPDRVLWAAYRVATCTVFPSLNEGFGLPAAESIAVGTPVVTSNFGSMREIGGSGGAILIDPRREEEIARGISSILKDPERRRRLHDEALALRPRTWNEYAAEVWEYFHSVP
jgi:glycosyltransferase involved in cell wall biosynthesis